MRKQQLLVTCPVQKLLLITCTKTQEKLDQVKSITAKLEN